MAVLNITKEMKESIRAMYRSGYSTGEIARYFGIAEFLVVKIVGIKY